MEAGRSIFASVGSHMWTCEKCSVAYLASCRILSGHLYHSLCSPGQSGALFQGPPVMKVFRTVITCRSKRSRTGKSEYLAAALSKLSIQMQKLHRGRHKLSLCKMVTVEGRYTQGNAPSEVLRLSAS